MRVKHTHKIIEDIYNKLLEDSPSISEEAEQHAIDALIYQKIRLISDFDAIYGDTV